MKIITIILLSGLFILSCKNNQKEVLLTGPQAPKNQVFGDSISTDGAISVADAMNGLKTSDSIRCTITGYVYGVCQVKGCWMTLSQEPKDSNTIFVKFKDYGFFVPKDLSGKKVTIKGLAFKEVTSVEELKHYAEDEAKSKEEIDAITSPQTEIKFMADGVIVNVDQQK